MFLALRMKMKYVCVGGEGVCRCVCGREGCVGACVGGKGCVGVCVGGRGGVCRCMCGRGRVCAQCDEWSPRCSSCSWEYSMDCMMQSVRF